MFALSREGLSDAVQERWLFAYREMTEVRLQEHRSPLPAESCKRKGVTSRPSAAFFFDQCVCLPAGSHLSRHSQDSAAEAFREDQCRRAAGCAGPAQWHDSFLHELRTLSWQSIHLMSVV